MSFRLVTLADIKTQLVYDDTLSDGALGFRLETVSQVIMEYIGAESLGLDGWTDSSGAPLMDSTGIVPATDSNGDSLVPGPVRAAVILSMAAWDESRGANLITQAVKDVLMRLRLPTVA